MRLNQDEVQKLAGIIEQKNNTISELLVHNSQLKRDELTSSRQYVDEIKKLRCRVVELEYKQNVEEKP